MNPDFSVSPATAAHIQTISRLAHAIWPATYGFLPPGQVDFMLGEMYSPTALTRQMTTQNQQFLLLQAKNQPIGFASYSASAQTNTAKLNKLYLLPDYHGKGLGKLLLQEVESQAAAAGCHTVYLNVNRFNPALSFYRSAGYAVVKEEDIPIGPYFMNDYVMQKKLSRFTPANQSKNGFSG